MTDVVQRERIADIVRPLVRDEIPRRSLYGLIALNLALIFVVIFVVLTVQHEQRVQAAELADREAVQAVWNSNLKGQLEGLKATVEFGPRIAALEVVQQRQLEIIAAIAEKLGIRELPNEQSSVRQRDPE